MTDTSCIHSSDNAPFSGHRNVWKWLLCIWLSGVMIGILAIFISVLLPPKYTEINDISEYGIFNGTHDDNHVRSQIEAFFPEKIEDFFEVVKYAYCAENVDSYGYEAYLEIRIEDRETFNNYIQSITAAAWTDFSHCEGYQEYTISDDIHVWLSEANQDASDPCYQIEWADIRKILYSSQEQTIIYVAIGVYDGGAADTEFLGVFFNRFDIDPLEYENNSR